MECLILKNFKEKAYEILKAKNKDVCRDTLEMYSWPQSFAGTSANGGACGLMISSFQVVIYADGSTGQAVAFCGSRVRFIEVFTPLETIRF